MKQGWFGQFIVRVLPPERAVEAAVLVAMLCLGVGLGSAALIDPDEGRNARIAQEMARSGDLLLPHLNDLPFLDKPFLYFSFAAAAIRILGESEFALRLPSLLMTWGSIAITFLLAVRVAGRAVAPLAALCLATTPLVLSMARTVIFDSALAFFVLAAIAAFHVALEPEASPGDRRRNLAWSSVAWLAVTLGLLTKGPVAPLLVFLVVLPLALWRRALWRRRARTLVRLPGPAIFLVMAGGWAAAVESRMPGFLHYGLVSETWKRLTTDDFDRSGSVWYFVPVLVGALFPWSWVAVAGLRGLMARSVPAEKRAAVCFLLLWIAVPLVLFSLSQSKRPQYLLPIVPAVSMLAAWALVEPTTRRVALRAGIAGWLIVAALGAAAAWFAQSSHAPARVSELEPLPAVTAIAALAALSAALAHLAGRGSLWRLAPVALALPVAALPLVSGSVFERSADARSGRALSVALAARLEPGTEVLGIETYSPSAAFYLRVPWIVISDDGAPLRSNSIVHFYGRLASAPASTLRPKSFWEAALNHCSRPYLFVVKPSYAPERAAFERANLPLIFASARYVAYGPCRMARSEAAPR